MPRHEESHVAIPLLAGLLLLVGCAGQMAGPPWDNVTGPLRQGPLRQGTL